METEIMQTVLNEVLEELKELKQQIAKLMTAATNLVNKVDDFEPNLNNIKVTAPATTIETITSALHEGVLRLARIIDDQPKSITRQYRILLFPESGAREYYRVVFGRLLFWMISFLVVTYIFSLGKRFIDGNSLAKYKEAESSYYRKAWNYLYQNSKKTMRAKMDTVLMRDYSK